jgi:hypothetical protein
MRYFTRVLLSLLFLSLLLYPAMNGSLWNLHMAQAETVQILFEFSDVVTSSSDARELAVAFHSVTFLDVDAHSMGEILLGTPEANTLQGERWFS